MIYLIYLNLLSLSFISQIWFLNIFAEKEIDKTVTYENSQLQSRPAYGDQSSYGGVDASQRYYPVCASCFSLF